MTPNRRSIFTLGIFLTIMFCIAIFGRLMILANTTQQHPPSSDTVQAVSKAISSPKNPEDLKQENTDYRLEDKHYFNDKEWLVATVVAAPPQQAEPATVIMTKDNGTYRIVTGPGTDFPPEALADLPAEVAQYLKDIGRISN